VQHQAQVVVVVLAVRMDKMQCHQSLVLRVDMVLVVAELH